MSQAESTNSNLIHFYSYYPHYLGDLSASSTIDATALLLVLELANEHHKLMTNNGAVNGQRDIKAYLDSLADEQRQQIEALDESVEEMLADIEDTMGNCHALTDAIRGYLHTPQDVINSLCKKGFYVDEWEEGGFYFATDEALEKAQKAFNRQEAKILAETRTF